MEYEIELTGKAKGELNALPDWLRGIVESYLFRLAESPSALSRPVVSPPYPPGGMMSEFDYGPVGDTLHHVAIFFKYRQDETKLVIRAIGYTALLVDGTD